MDNRITVCERRNKNDCSDLKQGGNSPTFPGFQSWPTPAKTETPPEITILSGRLGAALLRTRRYGLLKAGLGGPSRPRRTGCLTVVA